MKIANEKTFEEFDRLKDQLFAHKRSKTPKPKPPNPIKLRSFPVKTILGLTLSLGGMWLLAKNTNSIKEYLIQNNHLTYQQSLAYAVLHSHLSCKWKELMTWQTLDKNKYLANNLYALKLQSDLMYLTKARPVKKLYIETRSRFSIWILGWNNQEVVRYINAYGDLVQKNTTSKLMLGDLMRIWTRQTEKLIKREKVFAYYEKEHDKIGKECEKVNYLTKLQYSKEEYEQVMTECHRKIGGISRKISEAVKTRQAQERKQYKQT